MKNQILSLFMLFALITNAQVKFEKSLEQAFDKAKKENKIVFIDYYNSECSICKKVNPMLENQEIGDFYNKHFIGFKINTNDDSSIGDMEFLTKKGLHIDGVPKFIFFDQNKNFIHYSGISPETKAFFDVGEAAIDSSKQLSKTPELYKAGDRSLKLLYAYSSYALLFNDKILVNKIADDLYDAFPEENRNNISSYFVLKNAVFTTENGFFKHWVNNLDKLKDFEQGSNSGKEKEQLERIIANDLTNPDKKWTSEQLSVLRKQISLVNPTVNVDAILWEKELDAFTKEQKTKETDALLKKMLDQNKDEEASLYYIIIRFVSTVKNTQNLLFLKLQVESLLIQYQNPKNEKEKDFVDKLKALL